MPSIMIRGAQFLMKREENWLTMAQRTKPPKRKRICLKIGIPLPALYTSLLMALETMSVERIMKAM